MVYGIGTKSWNNSTEHRQMKKTRAEATKVFESAVRLEVEIRWSMCTCRSFRYAHDPELHRKLKSDRDWRTWNERQAGPDYFEERPR